MAQTICVLLDEADRSRLSEIAEDRSRSLKHILRARIVLLSAGRRSVLEVAREAGVSRPAVWRWQRRFGEEAWKACFTTRRVRPARHHTRPVPSQSFWR